MSENTTDNSNNITEESVTDNKMNFIPIPLRHVPASILKQIRIYLKTNDNFSLYKSTGLGFTWSDHNRLMESDIEYVYIVSRDFAASGGVFDHLADDIINDKTIPLEARVRFLYEMTICLANKVIESPINNATIEEIQKHCKKIINTLGLETDAMKFLIEAANHKDHEVAVHMANNCTLMMCFALKAGLTEKTTLATVGTGALLQDIGKTQLPHDLLEATGELSAEQKQAIQSHVKAGVNLVSKIDGIDEEIMDILSYHHERYDGSGYPGKLKGDKIPLMGQVAGLVDVFEAMISVRPYRERPLTVQEAIIEIESNMIEMFDKDLIHCFSGFVKYHLLGASYIPLEELLNYEIASLRVLDKASNPSGRRHDREYFRCQAKAKSLSYMRDQWVSDDIQVVTIYNISRSGIGFLSHMPFDEDKLIQIIINTNGNVLPLLAKSIRCNQQNRDWYTVGAKFLRTFTRSEFRAISEKLGSSNND